MPRGKRYVLDSDSEEYSETDVSYDSPRRRTTTVKRRSFSRRRQSPDSNTYLSPGVVNVSHVRRSNSTGGHRRVQDPMVVVDVHNDVRNRQESRDRHDRHLLAEDDIEEIDIIRSHRRPRAASNLSISRTPSPRQRDWELMMDQRILAKNDVRQDLELAKQQQEIERLERQIARAKEKRHEEHRSTRYIEEDYWEEDLSERLRKLERLERRTSREDDVKRMVREQHLKELEKKEHASAERERIRKELELEAARKEQEAEEKKKEMAKLKDKAVEEWQRAQEAKKMKEIEEKAKKDKEFRERLKADFGYTDEQVDALLKKEKKEGKNHGQLVVLEPEKTTYIKVHRKFLLPETLISYRLAWDWDERDSNYIIIKQWISEEFQEELFAHTRRLREGKLVTETSTTLTELKVNDRKKDKMYLVRKKSPAGRAWIFT